VNHSLLSEMVVDRARETFERIPYCEYGGQGRGAGVDGHAGECGDGQVRRESHHVSA